MEVKIHNFAKKCALTNISAYRRRNQNDLDKIIMDIYYGKLAEEAVYAYHKSFNEHITPPDYTIYSTRHKSYNEDLLLQNYWKLHVKSITEESASRYGISWLFQKNDPIVSNPGVEDILVLCIIKGKNISDVSIIEHRSANDVVWGKPRLKKLWDTKVCLYMDSKE